MYNLFTKEFIKLIIICFLSVFVFSCKEDTNTEKEIDLSKISYQINGLSSYSSENEIVTKLNDYEEISVLTNFDYDPFVYDVHTEMNSTLEENKAIKHEKRLKAKEYYSKLNSQYLKQVDTSGYKGVYVSNYLPCVEFIYDREYFIDNKDEILLNFSLFDDINKVYVLGGEKDNEYLTEVLEDSTAVSYLRSGLYPGTGVKVGILDGGIVDVDHIALQNMNIVVRDRFFVFETESEHSTMMAAVIASPVDGFCDEASIYSVEASGSFSDEFDWLIENEVDVINISCGDVNDEGIYKANSAYADYVVDNYDICIVAAAGNKTGQVYNVANPGMGYNVLTVGSYDGNGQITDYSCFIEDEIHTEKPNLVVRGTNITLNGFPSAYTGTSLACAAMSGFCTYLINRFPNVLNDIEILLTGVMAGCGPLFLDCGSIETNGMSDTAGCGLFNLPRAIEALTNYRSYVWYRTTPYTQETLVKQFVIRMEERETVTLVLYWNAYATGDEDETQHALFRIKITSPLNEVMADLEADNANYYYVRMDGLYAEGDYYVDVTLIGGAAHPNNAERVTVCYSRGW